MLFTDKNSDLKIKQITRLSEGSLFLLVTDLLCQSLAKVSRADNADVSFHILYVLKIMLLTGQNLRVVQNHYNLA